MNFLLNMNVNRDMTARLKGRGHICHPAGDVGMSRAKDIEIVAEAKRANEVISRMEALWSDTERPLLEGAIVSLSDKSLRIRTLPIESE